MANEFDSQVFEVWFFKLCQVFKVAVACRDELISILTHLDAVQPFIDRCYGSVIDVWLADEKKERKSEILLLQE